VVIAIIVEIAELLRPPNPEVSKTLQQYWAQRDSNQGTRTSAVRGGITSDGLDLIGFASLLGAVV
jgi:hypothetical protein